MADYTCNWYLKNTESESQYQQLPVLSEDLCEYLISNGSMSPTTCPNSFFTRKGFKSAVGFVVIPKSVFESDFQKTSGQLNVDLKIEWIRNNPAAELPTVDIVIEDLFIKRTMPIKASEGLLGDDDLIILELADRRDVFFFQKSYAYADEDILQSLESDVVSDRLINHLLDEIKITGYDKTVDVTNMFDPEGSFKQYWGDYRVDNWEALKEIVERSENVIFLDKDNTIVVQKLSHTDATVESALTTYASHLEDSDQNSNKFKTVHQWPKSFDFYFSTGVGKTEFGYKENREFVHSETSSLTNYTDVITSVFPITHPSDAELESSRDSVADNYQDEYTNQSAIVERNLTFNGVIDFEWKSEITQIGYTNNRLVQAKTFVSIETRHGFRFWQVPGDATGGGTPATRELIRFDFAETDWDTNDATANADLAFKTPNDVEASSDSNVFEIHISNGLVLKKPGTYGYWIPYHIFVEDWDAWATHTLAKSPSGTLIMRQIRPTAGKFTVELWLHAVGSDPSTTGFLLHQHVHQRSKESQFDFSGNPDYWENGEHFECIFTNVITIDQEALNAAYDVTTNPSSQLAITLRYEMGNDNPRHGNGTIHPAITKGILANVERNATCWAIYWPEEYFDEDGLPVVGDTTTTTTTTTTTSTPAP